MDPVSIVISLIALAVSIASFVKSNSVQDEQRELGRLSDFYSTLSTANVLLNELATSAGRIDVRLQRFRAVREKIDSESQDDRVFEVIDEFLDGLSKIERQLRADREAVVNTLELYWKLEDSDIITPLRTREFNGLITVQQARTRDILQKAEKWIDESDTKLSKWNDDLDEGRSVA